MAGCNSGTMYSGPGCGGTSPWSYPGGELGDPQDPGGGAGGDLTGYTRRDRYEQIISGWRFEAAQQFTSSVTVEGPLTAVNAGLISGGTF